MSAAPPPAIRSAVHRRAPTTTASASTAGSSATCPTPASTSSRAGRAPASCALDGKRAAPGDRIEAGQVIRVPPAEAPAAADAGRHGRSAATLSADEIAFVNEMVIHRDAAAIVVNKPPGLATQGGTKTNVHLDGLLDGLADEDGDAAQARPPARQGHVGRPAGRPHAARRRLLLEELFRPHRAQGLLGAGRRRARGRGRPDRPAARQAARHRRREDACRRGGGPGRRAPATG